MVTSVAVYAASFSKSTLRAILAAFVILVAGGLALRLEAAWLHQITPRLVRWLGHTHVKEGLILPFLCGALSFLLCLIQWFAWSNFRRCGPSARRLLVQFAVILLSLWLVALALPSAIFLTRGN
jgi:hypothetical protein